LKTYDTAVTDGSALFQTFRTDLAGTAPTSNMNLIDTFASSTSASILALQENKPIIPVSATYDSINFYIATVTDIVTYTTNTVIALTLNVTSFGTTGLKINALDTKYLTKYNTAGTLVNLDANELRKGKEYLFRYNGTSWVWLNATSADQISISGSHGNFVNISGSSGSGILVDSGVPLLSGITSGSYNRVGVDVYGRITDGSVVAYQTVSSISGSSVMSSTTGSEVRHNYSSVISGSYNKIGVDAFGHITDGSVVVVASSGADYLGVQVFCM
jgi:hypothetical protein